MEEVCSSRPSLSCLLSRGASDWIEQSIRDRISFSRKVEVVRLLVLATADTDATDATCPYR